MIRLLDPTRTANADVIHSDGSVPFAADQSMGGFKITNLGDPASATDAANKGYVDGLVRGLDWKASCRAATTANIALSGAQTIDGVSVIAGDRVLVKNQSTGSQNGIYVCDASTWSRAVDADASAEVTSGMATTVTEGTANGDKTFVLTTNDAITLGSTSLSFSQLGDGNSGGDVVGPGSSTDNGIPRFDGTTGKVIQASNSAWIIDDNGQMMGKSYAHNVVALADGATVTMNWQDGNDFEVTITDDRTLAFSNLKRGQWCSLLVIQGSGGSHNLGYPGSIVWADEEPIVWTETEGRADLIGLRCHVQSGSPIVMAFIIGQNLETT